MGGVREFDFDGCTVKSAIWKWPVQGRVAVRGVNLDGDDQADRRGHGGPDKAIYAYAIEDQRWWQGQIDRTLQYGEVGENLTTELSDAWIAWARKVSSSGKIEVKTPACC